MKRPDRQAAGIAAGAAVRAELRPARRGRAWRGAPPTGLPPVPPLDHASAGLGPQRGLWSVSRCRWLIKPRGPATPRGGRPAGGGLASAWLRGIEIGRRATRSSALGRPGRQARLGQRRCARRRAYPHGAPPRPGRTFDHADAACLRFVMVGGRAAQFFFFTPFLCQQCSGPAREHEGPRTDRK